jgi:Holliday junction DNA helicase RuvA
MIGRLRGILVEKRAPWLIVEMSNGLGYELEAPMSTFYRLPEPGSEITLYTHQVVREDANLLYGFSDFQERAFFRAVIKVNGIGPKLALTILSSLSSAEFVACINNSDTASLVRIPGVGKKTAERLVIEMRDRLADQLSGESASLPAAKSQRSQSESQQAVSALISLGYKPTEASKLISHMDCDGLSVEQIIKSALQGIMA